MTINKQELKNFFWGLQDEITKAVSAFDGNPFIEDIWEKPANSPLLGSGRSMILENGNFLERGGVAFSEVSGQKLPPSATANRPELAGRSFEAMGMSLVFHPINPKVPTVHMNVRCFVATKEEEEPVWWFGGGMDLTPYYGDESDCIHFHHTCQKAIVGFGDHLYPQFKKNCDDYFYLKHRNEARGIGGIFFDDFTELGFEQSFALTQSVGSSFLDAYLPIAKKHAKAPFTPAEKSFQEYRRGRYVEFNLVYDRGTLFGLQSGGRTESILMSMPPTAQWKYQWEAAEHSPEKRLTDYFLQPQDWLK